MTIDVDHYHLSMQQKLMWKKLLARQSAPLVKAWLTITGPDDERRISQALRNVMNRHEACRTSYLTTDREPYPYQYIVENVNLTVRYDDLSALPEHDRLLHIRDYWESQAHDSVTAEQVAHLALFRCTDSIYQAVVTMSALVCDRHSLIVLAEQWMKELNGVVIDEQDIVQYVDYCAWQQDNYQYANEQISSLSTPQAVLIPERFGEDSPRPDLVRTLVPQHIAERVRLLSASWDIDQSHIYMAGWYVLQHRMTGAEQIALDVVQAGRPVDDLAVACGPYERVKTIPLSMRGEEPFRSCVMQLHAAADSWAKQTYVWSAEEQANVHDAHIEETDDRLSFTYIERHIECAATANTITLDALVAVACHSAHVSVQMFSLSGGEVGICVGFDPARYSSQQIQSWVSQYVDLLSAYISEPTVPIGYVPLMSEREMIQIMNRSHGSLDQVGADQLPCVSVIDAFETQAAKQPDAIAVRCNGEQVSYRKLNRDVNRLAHQLSEQIVLEQRVGILSDKSYETIVSVLAVMKAGGVVVYMNPLDPDAKLLGVIEQANITLIITNIEQAQDRLPTCDVVWIVQSRSDEDDDLHTLTNIRRIISPSQLAYIMFTSGSTGVPKGVMIEHGSLMNYVQWVNDRLFGEEVNALLFTADLNFDSYLKQLFAPLTSGRAILLLDGERSKNPQAVWACVQEEQADAINCVPSVWEHLLSYVEQEDHNVQPNSLHSLYLGGEQLSPTLLDRTWRIYPQLRIWNLYGPTEATANATYALLQPGEEIVIGQPIANMHAIILDPWLHPVPPGVVGELYIGGAGLARGYMQQPRLTAKAFIPNFISDIPGDRLYRTGDLVRMNRQGQIVYVGRTDHMIKIHGVRIEPEDIQYHLRQMDGITHAVVVAHDQQLIAYCITERPEQITVQAVNDYLARRLPRAYLPSRYVILDRLPLTDVGKIDYQQLTQLPAQDIQHDDQPITEMEQMIASIWSSVLGRERIGRQDDFFLIGGHSITATQVTARVRRYVDPSISLRLLFEHSTLSSYALAVSKCRSADTPDTDTVERAK